MFMYEIVTKVAVPPPVLPNQGLRNKLNAKHIGFLSGRTFLGKMKQLRLLGKCSFEVKYFFVVSFCLRGISEIPVSEDCGLSGTLPLSREIKQAFVWFVYT